MKRLRKTRKRWRTIGCNITTQFLHIETNQQSRKLRKRGLQFQNIYFKYSLTEPKVY